MTETQQPPTSNWQPAAGGQYPMPQTGFPSGYGPIPPARPKRRRLLVAAVSAVLVVAATVTGLVALNHPKGSLILPARLLGLPKATSASARHLASELKAAEESGTGGKISGVVAGVYGNPTGSWLAITGGGICGSCSAKSAATQRRNLAASGYQNATSFPAGPDGGVLTCGSRTSQGNTVIRCTWVDDQTAGNALFAGGAASSLADAAAKTNQARAATEH